MRDDYSQRAREIAKEIGESMIRGELTNAAFYPYSDKAAWVRWNGPRFLSEAGVVAEKEMTERMHATSTRFLVAETYSWFVFTVEWLKSMMDIAQNKRVLEVCAGRGYLQPLMSKCCEWIATDSKPNNPWVKKRSALRAVKEYKPDIIFASWIPYQSKLDYWLAKFEIPFIIVGEGCGGCTGSETFHNKFDAQISYAEDVFPDFIQSPSWWAIHDYTSLVHFREYKKLIIDNKDLDVRRFQNLEVK